MASSTLIIHDAIRFFHTPCCSICVSAHQKIKSLIAVGTHYFRVRDMLPCREEKRGSSRSILSSIQGYSKNKVDSNIYWLPTYDRYMRHIYINSRRHIHRAILLESTRYTSGTHEPRTIVSHTDSRGSATQSVRLHLEISPPPMFVRYTTKIHR